MVVKEETGTMTRNPHWTRAASLGLATVVALTLPVVMSAGQGASAEKAPLTPQVTFAKDIAPILQRSCQGCHHPNSLAPMSLMTYEEVRPWARGMKTKTGLGTKAGVMPPWYMEKNIGIQKYKNDPSLSEAEIAKIATWADSGAPMGNPADMPPSLTFSEGTDWKIGQPDLIVSTPTVTMKALSPDWWGPIGETPTGLTEDRYVAAVEYHEVNNLAGKVTSNLGTNNSGAGHFIIHHMGTQPRVGDGPPNAAGGNFPTHEVGRNADVFEPGEGRLLKAGSVLVFGSAHLHAVGRDASAHVEVGFKFHPRGYKPTTIIRRMGLFGNSMNLDIKGMEANQQFQAFTVLAENAKVVAFEPHMHASGVRMCLDAISGAGMAVETLSCVGYDHSWVRVYTFADDAAPLLPKGTILRITGYFDNTPANRNVVDPRNWSGLGHRSIDNMMNQLGEVVYLTDEEFQAQMAQRRKVLHLTEGQSVIGCPLCGSRQLRVTAAANQGQ